ncbi:protein of unknown function [Micropruina glycogenica]|uniref:Uncharacterized protein n=1 Tax=Micropruina glycogenica TaxID=75385 RepID=A0A2N9JLN7_9ACTN|nr:protein of unknown function [Micropruina glycogenica]
MPSPGAGWGQPTLVPGGTECLDVSNHMAVEWWLRKVAVPVAEATLSDPNRSMAAEDVRAYFVGGRSAGAGRAV